MGLPVLCIAELAATGTDVSAYHKSGRTFSPTFSHIGTTSAAAYRVQAVGFYNAFCLGITFVGTDTYFEPFRYVLFRSFTFSIPD